MSIRADVDRGLEIRKQLAALDKELKAIETRLKEAGLKGEQVDLKDADRAGKQFLAAGTGVIIPVVFTADKIVGSFTAKSAVHQTISLYSNGKLAEFYAPTNKYESMFDDGKKFRRHAMEILGDRAPAFLTACIARDKDGIPKSDIKVCWDAAEEVPS